VRYLVTGGAGFIGSHLVDALVAGGDEVLVLDDLSTGRRENIEHALDSGSVEFIEGSVLDMALVDECVRSADVCVHLAAAVGVRLVLQRPLDTLLGNIRGNDVVISAAARHRRKLIFASTSEVYGKNGQEPLAEESDGVLGSPFKSRWAYAHSKSFGEALAYAYWKEQGTPVVVARLFNVVGPRQGGAYGMVLPTFVHQALSGRPLTVFGNGTQSRCFGHVQDVVEALILLSNASGAEGNVYNVGSSAEMPIIELARRVIERTGSRAGIAYVSYEEAYGEGFEELWRRKPDTKALEQVTGWTPTRSVDEAIDGLIADMRDDQQMKRRLRLAG
jgi:UDP-glucose 4-epimerase